jgi:hypothetical protein
MQKPQIIFLLTSILLSACAFAPTSTPTAAPATATLAPTSTKQATFTPVPTFTPTIEPTITPSPTPTEIPFVSFSATVDKCTADQTEQRGYASWTDLLAGELVGSPYNSREVEGWGLVYSLVLVRAKVLDVVVVPVTTDYWKAQGVNTAHLLCIAFPQSSEAGLALGGFTLTDGTYVPMITHLNGGDPTGDGSDDTALPSASSLTSLIEGLYFMRVATYNGFVPSRLANTWKWITEEKDSAVPYSQVLYEDEIVRRGQLGEKLWFAAVTNPDGYVRDSLGYRIAYYNKHGSNSNFEYEAVLVLQYIAGEYSSDWSTITTREPVEDGFVLIDKFGTDDFGVSALPNAYR